MNIPAYYEFFSQHKIISGASALEHLPVELESMNAVKPLVIADAVDFDRSMEKKFLKAFYDSNVVIGALYDEVLEYSSTQTVRNLAKLFRARGCDSIIAVGGGAVMDTAKGVNILVSEQSDALMDYAGTDNISAHLKPLVAVPTADYTGLEMTNSAEIDRHLFTSDKLYPDIVCIDYRTARGCCTECVVNSTMVALTQAVESAAEPNQTPLNDAYALAALQLISENFIKGLKRPKNKKASLALANARTFAGISFSNAPAGMVYLLGKALETLTGHNSGAIMSVLLPLHLEIKLKARDSVRDELLLAMNGFDVYAATPKKERASLGVSSVNALIGDLGFNVPLSLSGMTIPKYRLADAAELTEEKSLGAYKKKNCLELLERSWE